MHRDTLPYFNLHGPLCSFLFISFCRAGRWAPDMRMVKEVRSSRMGTRAQGFHTEVGHQCHPLACLPPAGYSALSFSIASAAPAFPVCPVRWSSSTLISFPRTCFIFFTSSLLLFDIIFVVFKSASYSLCWLWSSLFNNHRRLPKLVHFYLC